MGSLRPTKRTQVVARSNAAASGEYKGTRTLISGAPAFLGVRPQCPRCRANINQLECQFCGLRMRIHHGIIHALPQDRAAHYVSFMEDDRVTGENAFIDCLEQEYYLDLPYRDLSGRDSEQWRIRAHNYNYLLEHVLARNLLVDGGRILDLGAGNCWMSYRMALARYRPFAVDVLTNDRDGLGAGEHFRNHLPTMFPRFQAEFTHLPFQDEQFEAAVFNASFHYAEDYKATFREAFRCVKSGGLVIVSDTPRYSRLNSGLPWESHPQAALGEPGGTTSNSIKTPAYRTDERMRALEEQLSIRWTIHSPRYGLLWSIRPFLAKLCNRRDPSRFRIYVTRKP
jgi:SAM-dependent methyltransferase